MNVKIVNFPIVPNSKLLKKKDNPSDILKAVKKAIQQALKDYANLWELYIYIPTSRNKIEHTLFLYPASLNPHIKLNFLFETAIRIAQSDVLEPKAKIIVSCEDNIQLLVERGNAPIWAKDSVFNYSGMNIPVKFWKDGTFDLLKSGIKTTVQVPFRVIADHDGVPKVKSCSNNKNEIEVEVNGFQLLQWKLMQEHAQQFIQDTGRQYSDFSVDMSIPGIPINWERQLIFKDAFDEFDFGYSIHEEITKVNAEGNVTFKATDTAGFEVKANISLDKIKQALDKKFEQTKQKRNQKKLIQDNIMLAP